MEKLQIERLKDTILVYDFPCSLAEELRPKTLDDVVGQDHLLGVNGPIKKMTEKGMIQSMILWGPPGTGKTSLAHVISKSIESEFVFFSAVTSGVEEVRRIVKKADIEKTEHNKQTVLFVDEIHRFNKAQQDAFLPHVENGTIILIGATTENPGFRVNAPLISRSQVYVLHSLLEKDLLTIAVRAFKKLKNIKYSKEALDHLVAYSNGDARTLINSIELASQIASNITLSVAEEVVQRKAIFYDKKGDYHYDTISAFIKSMRGSDPDASLHYLARMMKAGRIRFLYHGDW